MKFDVWFKRIILIFILIIIQVIDFNIELVQINSFHNNLAIKLKHLDFIFYDKRKLVRAPTTKDKT